jgi:hypothetical protein
VPIPSPKSRPLTEAKEFLKALPSLLACFCLTLFSDSMDQSRLAVF